MKKLAGLFLLTLMALVIGACENKWSQMSNQELAEKNAECVRGNPTAPGKVTACENIRKECERRRSEGNYSC